jgi:hypothetical protein
MFEGRCSFELKSKQMAHFVTIMFLATSSNFKPMLNIFFDFGITSISNI